MVILLSISIIYSISIPCPPVSRQAGRNYDQLQNANPLVMRGLVPATLMFLRIDSLYITTGEAVRYNCQTAGVWRLGVWAGDIDFTDICPCLDSRFCLYYEFDTV